MNLLKLKGAALINIIIFLNSSYISCMKTYKEDPNTQLLNAVRKGDLKLVSNLTESGANVNYLKGFPLSKAAKKGHHKIVKFLLKNKAEVNCLRNLPLVNAIERGHFKVVKILLFYGAAPNYPEALTIKKAEKLKNYDILSLLKACNIQEAFVYFKNPENANLETIQKCINTQFSNNQLLKLLTLSCIFKNYPLCREILKKIKPECANIRCCIYLPITHAALNGNKKIISLLVEAGVSIPLAAIIKASQKNHYKIATKLLLLVLGYENVF